MKAISVHSIRTRRAAQRGFTLVELMIALVIALFLIGGLVTLVGAMKITYNSQSGLSQLQDNERMAMTLITNVVESTGYFPNPLINTAATSFPSGAAPVSGTFASGQAIIGTGHYSDPAPGNTITVRYLTTGSDNVINCTGNTSGVGVAATFVNTFSIDANGNLDCTLIVNGTAQPTVQLVSGLNSMNIYYGVQTNGGVSTNSIDTYLDASSMTASDWSNVKSVQIKLNFVNPLYGQPGQTNSTQQYISFTRVIDVMNKNGAT
ncbi:MAG: PilW family protein [Steroidobacteraceae bacterium]|jgi:type IV pilus assembly protein PilW